MMHIVYFILLTAPFAGKLDDVTHSGIFWLRKWPFIIGNTSQKNEQCFTLHDTAPSKGEGIPDHLPLGSKKRTIGWVGNDCLE